MSHVAAEIAPDYTMPCLAVLFVKFLLYKRSNIFLHRKPIKCLYFFLFFFFFLNVEKIIFYHKKIKN